MRTSEHTGTSEEAPGTTVTLIHGFWSEALERDDVDPEADFFEMGGHSLLALRITGRVSESLDVDVPMPVLLRNPTLRSFSEAVDALVRER